jgi:hypothetical protein
VAERYFSVADVEALIPELMRVMEQVMSANAAAGEARERLQAEQRRIDLAGGGVLDRRAWRADRDRIERLTAEIQRGLGQIAELGGVPKDLGLGLGLVDFRHLRNGREVNLCWKYGEREIRHWHGLDEGYAGRKPL